jgi:predicted O-linked N-acetylglucosamine transferase (SPINDLY family)
MPKFTFEMHHIPNGAKLIWHNEPEIFCNVVEENKVNFRKEIMTLQEATEIIFNELDCAKGSRFQDIFQWKYNGKLLKTLHYQKKNKVMNKNDNANDLMLSSTLLGDAGEYYALSQFLLNGHKAIKMPDKWEMYDIAIEDKEKKLLTVSVKTRSESVGWKNSKWFSWSKKDKFDVIVLVFISKDLGISSWIIPSSIANSLCSKPSVNALNQNYLELSWKKLNSDEQLLKYKDNWTIS